MMLAARQLAPGRPIAASDIDLLRELTGALGSPLSEVCAANLYLFREVHRYRLIDDAIVTGRTYDGEDHFLPLTRLPDAELADIARAGLSLYPVTRADAEAVDRLGLEAVSNPDDSDYVFKASDLATLSGPERKARRNLRTQFRRASQPRDEPFGPQHAADALAVLDAWLADVDQPWSQTDYVACREAIALFQPLGLVGMMSYAGGGEAAGFLLCGRLGDGSAAIHFAKGRRAYPGVFAHLFSRFAELNADQFQLLNFEQDLGKPGFRQAKRSYGPARLLEKCRLRAAGRN